MASKAAPKTKDLPSPFQRVLPAALSGKDSLILRLDFYKESIVMQEFRADNRNPEGTLRLVSARDLADAISSEMSYSSGLLPPNALWWTNSRSGPVTALWVEPGIRRLALQTDFTKPPERYDVPLPGLIFLCRPGHAPHVYAASKRPEGPKAPLFKAPLANVYDSGATCPGSHRYGADMGKIPDEFLTSFFTREANIKGRSKRFPEDVTRLWKELHGKKEFPLSDLIHHGTVADMLGVV